MYIHTHTHYLAQIKPVFSKFTQLCISCTLYIQKGENIKFNACQV